MYPEIKLLHTVDTVHCIHRIKLILSTQKLRIIQSLERYYIFEPKMLNGLQFREKNSSLKSYSAKTWQKT